MVLLIVTAFKVFTFKGQSAHPAWPLFPESWLESQVVQTPCVTYASLVSEQIQTNLHQPEAKYTWRGFHYGNYIHPFYKIGMDSKYTHNIPLIEREK